MNKKCNPIVLGLHDYEEEVMEQLKAEKDAKKKCVENAKEAMRNYSKRLENDCWLGLKKKYLVTKYVRGGDTFQLNRSSKAEKLFERAEKITGGKFNLLEVI